MSKTLLLDVDGVLIRDRLLLSHVKDNAVQYVRSKVPSSRNPAQLNAFLLKTHGHTAIGLNKAFRIDTSDFDERVYDKKLINHLWSVISGTEFQQEAKIIYDIAKEGIWKVKLFSNSPLQWTMPVALAISDLVGVQEHEYLKPQGLAYRDFSPSEMYMFIDDQVKNLRPVKDMPNWRPIHFNPALHTTRPEFITSGSIWEAQLAASVFLDPVQDVFKI